MISHNRLFLLLSPVQQQRVILLIITTCLLQCHHLVSGQGDRFSSNPQPASIGQSSSPSSGRSYAWGDRPPFPYSPPFLAVKSIVDRDRYYHSDSRCLEDIVTNNWEEVVTVNLRYGKVTGRISYLCDVPGLPLRDRPAGSTWSVHGSGSGLPPSTNYGQYTSFGGGSQQSNFQTLHTSPGGGGRLPFPSQPTGAYRPRVRGNATLFLGIPYAKGPLARSGLRFKPPQPPDFWGSLEAIDFKASCPQPIR